MIRYSFVNKTVFFASLSSLLCGYALASFNCTVSTYGLKFKWCGNEWQTVCDNADLNTALAINSVFAGAVVGCALATRIMTAGRLFAFKMANVFFATSAASCWLATSVSGLIIGRLLSGIGTGLAMVVVPMYISELAPRADRGFYVVMHQLMVTIGIFIGMACGLGLATPSETEEFRISSTGLMWLSVTALLPILPVLTQMAYFVRHPIESPTWFLKKGSVDDTLSILRKVYDEDTAKDVLHGMHLWHAVRPPQIAGSSLGFMGALQQPQYRSVVWVGTTLACLNKLTGIDAFVGQCSKIFYSIGIPSSKLTLATVCLGGLNVVMTLPSTLVVDNKKFGRRFLLLWGSVGMTISLGSVVLTSFITSGWFLQWTTFIAVLLYVCSFAVGMGPMLILYINEIYPAEIKEGVISFNMALNWAISAAVGYLAIALGSQKAFAMFTAAGVFSVFFIAYFCKETAGTTLGTGDATPAAYGKHAERDLAPIHELQEESDLD